MPKLPRISGRECVNALEKVGFYFVRRAKSNHIYMRRDNPFAVISVPDHRELHTGTLREIISQSGLTVQEFIDLI